MTLEVVLSTDGVQPLYFITSDDLTYQAKCPGALSNKTAHANKDRLVAHLDLSGTSVKKRLLTFAVNTPYISVDRATMPSLYSRH